MKTEAINRQVVTARSFRKATQSDIAREAGVSVATISNFLAGRSGACAPETAQRIEEAVEKLHYVPNSLERSLRLGKTKCLGVSAGNGEDDYQSSRDSFGIRFWTGAFHVASERDYSMLLYPVSARDGLNASAYLDGRVDGFIMMARAGDPRLEKIVAAGMPAVFTDVEPDLLPRDCGAVYCDENLTAALALDYLTELGHRRIAHLSAQLSEDPGIEESSISIRRTRGYKIWMQKRGCYDPGLVELSGGWNGGRIAEAVRTLFDRPDRPTALFCANDRIAWNAIEILKGMGLSVPGDVSVVGVDHYLSEDRSLPILTTVDIPVVKMGEEAVRTLFKLLDGAAVADCRVVIPVTRLVEGNTTAPVALLR